MNLAQCVSGTNRLGTKTSPEKRLQEAVIFSDSRCVEAVWEVITVAPGPAR